MSSLSLASPFPIFTDIDGNPLEDGYVYIGTAGLNAQTNPIQAYWDAALSVPAAQPIRTLGGYPSRSGSPGTPYVNADDCSILVKNKNGSLIFSSLNQTARYSSGAILFAQSEAGAVSRTVLSKLRESVSVVDFGAAITNTALQNKAAFEAALATGKNVYIPAGIWPIEDVSVPDNACIQGAGMYLTVLKVTSGQDGLVLGGNPPATYITANLSDFTLENDELYSTVSHTGRGLVLTGVVDSSFDNILIQYFQYGAYARSSWDLKFGLFKAYNCTFGFKVPRIGVDGNLSFNSVSFGTFVSEANITAGFSFGYGANISIGVAQLENQLVGGYMAEVYFIDIGTTYWEWAAPSGSGELVYAIGQDEGGNFGNPKYLNLRNIMTSSNQAQVALRNVTRAYISGELGYADLILAGTNSAIELKGTNPTPKFLAYRDTQVANVTGDGTAYTVIPDIEVFDDGGGYNAATGVFTAPQTGKYRLTACVFIGNMAAGHDTQQIRIVTSNRTYYKYFKSFDAANTVPEQSLELSVLADMDAGNTAYIEIYVTGTPVPAKQVFVFAGAATMRTWFCGELVQE